MKVIFIQTNLFRLFIFLPLLLVKISHTHRIEKHFSREISPNLLQFANTKLVFDLLFLGFLLGKKNWALTHNKNSTLKKSELATKSLSRKQRNKIIANTESITVSCFECVTWSIGCSLWDCCCLLLFSFNLVPEREWVALPLCADSAWNVNQQQQHQHKKNHTQSKRIDSTE